MDDFKKTGFYTVYTCLYESVTKKFQDLNINKNAHVIFMEKKGGIFSKPKL